MVEDEKASSTIDFPSYINKQPELRIKSNYTSILGYIKYLNQHSNSGWIRLYQRHNEAKICPWHTDDILSNWQHEQGHIFIEKGFKI
jgi:hypothetical protein